MIIEIVALTGAMALGAALAHTLRKRRPAKGAQPRPKEAERARGALDIGDVLLYLDDELWLAGCVTGTEVAVRFRLFTVPGVRSAEWLAELDGEHGEIALLRNTYAVPEGALPDRLPLASRLYIARERARVELATAGEHVPALGMRAEYVRFDAAAGYVLMVLDSPDGSRTALVGERLPRALFDRLPGTPDAG